MKHFILLAAAIVVSVPAFAQPGAGGPMQPGGPIQLRNPHRRSNGFGGGGFGASSPDGGRGGGMMQFGDGGNAIPFPSGNGNDTASFVPAPAPPVSMFADGPYLFILRGDSLFQFDKKTLKLLNSIELPHPVIPASPSPASTPGDLRTYTSPPLRPGAGFQDGAPGGRGGGASF